MILVDSSVGVDHFRQSDTQLVGLLADLPQAVVATDDEVMGLITREALFGLGIGYVDCHLIASARLSANTRLWTRDKRLQAVATKLGV